MCLQSFLSAICSLISPVFLSPVSLLRLSTKVSGGLPRPLVPWLGSQRRSWCAARSSCRWMCPTNLILLACIYELTLGSDPKTSLLVRCSLQSTLMAEAFYCNIRQSFSSEILLLSTFPFHTGGLIQQYTSKNNLYWARGLVNIRVHRVENMAC